MVIKNKKGWIRIVEALVAILLIVGFLTLIINKGEQKSNLNSRIGLSENSILREIQINSTYRNYILGTSGTVEFEDLDSNLNAQIISRTPEYLNCVGQICEFDNDCDYVENSGKDIYGKSVFIGANSEVYSPKQLKLFCWLN